MTKVTIITQNFSSPNDVSDTPLMLLPQAPPPPKSTTAADKDQDGFNQLLLHDRHRQRQSYIQSYTAFETLKKRQDFVLRQENLRSLQKFVERMATKQDQFIDQSFYSYKQCFGKFINVRPSTQRNLQEQSQRPKTAGPSYDRTSHRQLIHVPTAPLEPAPSIPSHRYQKSNRPSSSTRYRTHATSLRTPRQRQDPFRTTSFISHSQPFISFSENYLQKYDGPTTKSQVIKYNSGIDRATHKLQTTSNFNNDSATNRSTIKKPTNGTRTPNKAQAAMNTGENDLVVFDDDDDDNLPTKVESAIPTHDDQLLYEHVTETNLIDDMPLHESPITGVIEDEHETTDDPEEKVTHKTTRQPSITPAALITDHVTNSTDARETKTTEYVRPVTTESKYPINTTVKVIDDLKTQTPSNNRSNTVSRLTNTPASTPEMNYTAALQDGLVKDKTPEPNTNKIKPAIIEERRFSQQSNTLTNDSRKKTPISQKRPKSAKKKHTIVVAVPVANNESFTAPTGNDDAESIENAITVQNYGNNLPEQTITVKPKRRRVPVTLVKKPVAEVRRPSIPSKTEPVKTKDETPTQTKAVVADKQAPPVVVEKKEDVVPVETNILPKQNQQPEPIEEPSVRTKKNAFETSGPAVLMTNAELKALGSHRTVVKKTKFHLGKSVTKHSTEKVATCEPETLELIEKIRQGEVGNEIGRTSISKQGCRFELPSDLKKLEGLTPLEYIGRYCRFSSHRRYQFKRIFDKYRNSKHAVELTDLYSAVTDVHTDSFTRSQYDELCHLIGAEDPHTQFSFETFSGVLAVCERLVYDALNSSSDPEDYELAKDPLEKCDFYSLKRKLDGFNISKELRKLIHTL
ncbi:unnamed protein product [Adineta ricciae]|uniref:Uncharacterized protein n=1 Tax=Adineta ricciae TaxID=249248 RepID=A0A816CK70_ADIRI|nr:unnamed protein product [Adineta ricciae]